MHRVKRAQSDWVQRPHRRKSTDNHPKLPKPPEARLVRRFGTWRRCSSASSSNCIFLLSTALHGDAQERDLERSTVRARQNRGQPADPLKFSKQLHYRHPADRLGFGGKSFNAIYQANSQSLWRSFRFLGVLFQPATPRSVEFANSSSRYRVHQHRATPTGLPAVADTPAYKQPYPVDGHSAQRSSSIARFPAPRGTEYCRWS